MDERMMRIRCPQCGAGYRVDRDAVPLEGATAECKKCGQRFAIKKSEPESAGGSAAVPRTAAGPPREATFTCPSCGRRQAQPYNCYACGEVITPKEPSSTAPAAGGSSSKRPAFEPSFGPAMGEIVVRTRFEKSDWPLNFVNPRVSLDGMEHHQGWGVHAFQAPEGDCPVVIDYKYFINFRGRGAITVHVSPAEKVYVDYCPRTPFPSAAGTIRRASTAEGLLWPIQAKSNRPVGKGLYSRKAVIISLIVMGPLGLYPLWKSEAFSNRTKIVITAVVVLLFYWIFSKLSLPKVSSISY